MPPLSPVSLAFLAGVMPALFWLWFWLREDKLHPEPRRFIAISFLLGMLAVLAAVPLEQLATLITDVPLTVFVFWALIEELLKYAAAYMGGMHTQAEDEPIDAMVYLITAALGFAAAENALFLLEPFIAGQLFTGAVTLNIRFVGTTLLHILGSATIGAALSFCFYRRQAVKAEHFLVGLSLAVVLHAAFNMVILRAGPRGMFAIFACVWVLIIALLLIFEKVKNISRTADLKN